MTPVAGPFAESFGWRLYQSSAFAAAFAPLEAEVQRLAKENPRTFAAHPKAKLYRRIVDLITEEIPRDPNAAAFQLGNTLGPTHRHWRRAKIPAAIPIVLPLRQRQSHHHLRLGE